MKSLILLRHAEAQSTMKGQSDLERPLNDKGKEDAHNISRKIVDAGLTPNLFLSSPALRTQQTAAIVATACHYDLQDIQYDKRIFDNTLDLLFKVIHDLDDTFDQVLIIGHNPSLTALLHTICGTTTLNLGTCCVAEIQLDCLNWSDVTDSTGQCRWFCYPSP